MDRAAIETLTFVLAGEAAGDVDSDGGLADPALQVRHGDDAGQGMCPMESTVHCLANY